MLVREEAAFPLLPGFGFLGFTVTCTVENCKLTSSVDLGFPRFILKEFNVDKWN